MPLRRGAALFFVFSGMPCRCRGDKTGAAAPRPPRCCGGAGDQRPPGDFFPLGVRHAGRGRNKRRLWGGGGWPVAAGRAGNSRKRRRSAKPPPRRSRGAGDERPPGDFFPLGVRHAGRGKKKRRPWGGGGWSALCRTMRKNPPKRRPVPLRPAGGKGAVRAQGAPLGDWGRFAPDLVRCGLRRRFPGNGCSAQRPGSSERPVR